jgi:predicted transcriptional regulator
MSDARRYLRGHARPYRAALPVDIVSPAPLASWPEPFQAGGHEGRESQSLASEHLPPGPACTTLSYMAGTITIRVDAETERMLKRVVKLSGRTRSEITREALRRQLSLDLFEQLRRRVAPFAEARGLLTDEDVFKALS